LAFPVGPLTALGQRGEDYNDVCSAASAMSQAERMPQIYADSPAVLLRAAGLV
jgi:hypothetical protein